MTTLQCWQVSASSGLNIGLNRFKPSWKKQVSTRVSATLAETASVFEPVFIQNYWYTFENKAVIFVLFCSILFGMVKIEFCYQV